MLLPLRLNLQVIAAAKRAKDALKAVQSFFVHKGTKEEAQIKAIQQGEDNKSVLGNTDIMTVTGSTLIPKKAIFDRKIKAIKVDTISKSTSPGVGIKAVKDEQNTASVKATESTKAVKQ